MNQDIYIPPETPQQAVEEFYREKRGSAPSIPEALQYLEEEIIELAHELYCYDCDEFLSEEGEQDDESVAKELADVMFTLYGVAIAADIDLDKAFRLVVESNMRKQKTPDGKVHKVQKGESYIEPDMSGALL